MSGNPDAVITRNGNIIRHPHVSRLNCIITSKGGKIIRIKNAGGRFLQIKQRHGFPVRALSITVGRHTDILVRHGQPKLPRRPVKGGQPALGHCGICPMDIGYPAMPLLINICEQILHPLHIIGHHRTDIIKQMIQRHRGNPASHKLQDFRRIKIRTDDGHPVKSA